jgi:hypothetical protein
MPGASASHGTIGGAGSSLSLESKQQAKAAAESKRL